MTALPEAERIARLRLARTEKIGPVTFSQLIQKFGTAVDAIDRLPDLVKRSGRSAYRVPSVDDVTPELERGHAYGARLLVLGDAAYPARLAAIDPPPPVLWTKGRTDLLNTEAVAIVGARIASAGGIRIARSLAQDLGQHHYTVVSGLARGIDTAAHLGSLETGTVAVLGGGVDDIYPPENADLHARIGTEGCIVSESPMGARAQARDFPRRNRIISGLSRGTVVVEAELKSGSLITARLAAEQGRDVFAVPGSPLDPRTRGTNDLLRQGAILCEGIEDIERAFTTLRTLFEPSVTPSFEPANEDCAPDLLEQIAALLSPVPTPTDEIARALGVSASVVAGALLELSLTDRASLLPGGLVASA
ncbi:DNA-processing protein DprA [uncultured Brevundimonas sp.]|uniref:DNA-processing protein DprA n=1 Tax=uncultured Brevundimonas sp. TaxID=213418 RepID=UPI0026081A4C|nr:DNA-processing protein DprA [uncultured Brevundimonas sp.]